MTQSDPFAYFEETLHADCASLLPDAFSRSSDEPDFVLVDDADGRFVVDPRSGLICVANEDVLERDRGGVYKVRLETREAFGSHYVMTLRLKISGLVPGIARDAEPVVQLAEATPLAPWRDFAAFLAQDTAFPSPDRDARFGEAVSNASWAFGSEDNFDLEGAALALDTPLPAPADDHAWA